jgi:hypothetical protein
VHPGTAPPDAWYLDSEASTHVSPDLNAFTTYTPYTGADQLKVGDGKGLPILYTATVTLPSSNSSLLLTNVLHVPTISKSLLNIS